MNFLIIHKATQYSRSQKAMGRTPSRVQSERKKAQMTRMILFITFLYISVSFPIEIYAAFLYIYASKFYYQQLLTNIIVTIQFAYPSLHFFILIFSNKLFANESKEIASSFRNRQIINSSSLSSHRKRFRINADLAQNQQT